MVRAALAALVPCKCRRLHASCGARARLVRLRQSAKATDLLLYRYCIADQHHPDRELRISELPRSLSWISVARRRLSHACGPASCGVGRTREIGAHVAPKENRGWSLEFYSIRDRTRVFFRLTTVD